MTIEFLASHQLNGVNLYITPSDDNLSGEYVSLAEYQDAQITIQNLQSQMSIDGHNKDCAALQAASVDCSCGLRDVSTQENARVLKLEALLKRWNEIAPYLYDYQQLENEELIRLYNDTSEAIK